MCKSLRLEDDIPILGETQNAILKMHRYQRRRW